MIDKISLYCTFPEVLMQAVGERKGGTFGSLRVVLAKFFFQFALIAAHFRSLQVIIKQTDHTTVDFNITPETTITGVGINNQMLLFDRITAENSKL